MNMDNITEALNKNLCFRTAIEEPLQNAERDKVKRFSTIRDGGCVYDVSW